MGPRSRTRWAAAATVSAVSLAATVNAAEAANASVSWCATTDKVVLTTCGDSCTALEQGHACVQYPTKSSTKCSDAVRNTCLPSPEDESCTFQCIVPYDTSVSAWRLFVKDPVTSDGFANDPSRSRSFPAAPVDLISGIQVPADAKSIQITGFDNNDLAKGSVKTLTRDDNFFALSQQADQLVFANIDLEKLPTNFLPKSLSKLTMNNCKLTEVPSDVGGMGNLRSLNLSKNSITDLPSADSKTGTVLKTVTYLGLADNELTKFDLVLPALTTLDLRDNKLTTFPQVIFNMTNLKTLLLDGNVIQATNFTAAQVLFLGRFTPNNSTLGFSAGACAAGEREETVLGSTVCVVDAAAAAAATPAPATTNDSSSSGGSGTVVILVCVVAGAVLLVGGGAFIWHKRRAKQRAFYESVMDQQHSRTGPNAYYSNTAGTRQTNNFNSGGTGGGHSRSGFFSRSRAPSGGGRPSRAHSSGSARPSLGVGGVGRPSKASFSSSVPPGTYMEIAKYQEERQSGAGGATSSMSLATGGSCQRERAQINQNVVRIASQEINYTRTIAKGAFGEVWLAHYGRDLVAVKKLLSRDPTSVGDLIAELNLLASLAHPRVLALVGACWDDAQQQDLQIVMEYMDSGDLLTVLRQRSPAELSWEKGKAAYCVQICEAVFYLHSLQPALIHRDIKSRNILIDARKGAKLSDFGESRERTIQNTMTAGVGTARWVAPEIILGEDYSELADIYSLGVLLTELDTHKIPFEGLNLEEHMIVQQVSVGKLRPTVSESCPEVIRRLVHECLQFDPQLRPSAARVLQTLMASPLVRRLSTISDEE